MTKKGQGRLFWAPLAPSSVSPKRIGMKSSPSEMSEPSVQVHDSEYSVVNSHRWLSRCEKIRAWSSSEASWLTGFVAFPGKIPVTALEVPNKEAKNLKYFGIFPTVIFILRNSKESADHIVVNILLWRQVDLGRTEVSRRFCLRKVLELTVKTLHYKKKSLFNSFLKHLSFISKMYFKHEKWK